MKLKSAATYRKIAKIARRTAEDLTRTDLNKEDRAKLYRGVLLAESLARTMAKREAQKQQASEPPPDRDESNERR